MDPLHDERFPDRPQHPDFWRLAEIAYQNDGDSGEGGLSPFTIMGVDEESFMYLMQHRIRNFLQTTSNQVGQARLNSRSAQPYLAALYLDAFALGKKFAERGGHTDPVRES